MPSGRIPLAAKLAGTAYWPYLYGFNDAQPQTWVNQNLYVVLWFGALWLFTWLPTHLILRNIFAVPPAATPRWKPAIPLL